MIVKNKQVATDRAEKKFLTFQNQIKKKRLKMHNNRLQIM